jgi:anti-sigma-K factor RskA
MDEAEAAVRAEHPDAAGWALGVLDPEDAAQFETHVASCEQCQREVAEFGPAARLLKSALPAIELMPDGEPPPGLAPRTLAAVERAARKALWRRRNIPLLTAAAAMVVAAVIAVSLTLSAGSSPALAFSIPLHASSGAASGQAVAQQASDGWSIRLTVQHLPALPAGSFYECWYAGPGNAPGHPELITAGTFTVGSDGGASVQMWSAADPRTFATMQITAERPGDATQHGAVILSGDAQR